jgi:hypothetical protein
MNEKPSFSLDIIKSREKEYLYDIQNGEIGTHYLNTRKLPTDC